MELHGATDTQDKDESELNSEITSGSAITKESSKHCKFKIELNGTADKSEINGSGTKSSELESSSKEKELATSPATSPAVSGEQHIMDAGWAWMVLLGGALNHMLGDGIISSLGVFLVVWQDQFPGSVSQLSWIISLILGVAYIAGPISTALCKTFSIRQVVMAGTVLTSLSFIAASFATSLWHLYTTFALAGLGLALTIQPTSVITTYYFDKLLARANGISYAGVGVGIFILSPLLQVFIDIYGWQGALLIVAGLVGNLGICAALYRPTPLEIESRTNGKTRIQDNLPTTETNNNKCSSFTNFFLNILASFDFTLLKNFQFSLLLIANFLYGNAYAIVILFLPARAVHAGIPELHSAFLVSVIGISSFISRITHGYVIDYKIMTATVLTAISYFVAAITCVVNPVTDKYGGLITLSTLMGLSSGVFNSTIPIIAKEYVGLQQVSGGVGLLHLMMGTGVTLGSYLAGFLFDATNSYDIPFFVAGACFLVCSMLIFVHPVSNYLQRQDEDAATHYLQRQDNGATTPNTREMHGQDNIAVQID